MLDLDSLAATRAKSLSQGEDSWREAVWSEDFQKLSSFMSDGEVESLIAICPSVNHFRLAVAYLNAQAAASGMSPFQVLTMDSEKDGLKPSDWILRKFGDGASS